MISREQATACSIHSGLTSLMIFAPQISPAVNKTFYVSKLPKTFHPHQMLHVKAILQVKL